MKAFEELARKAADPDRVAKTAAELIASDGADAWFIAQRNADDFLSMGNTKGFENWSAVVREIQAIQASAKRPITEIPESSRRAIHDRPKENDLQRAFEANPLAWLLGLALCYVAWTAYYASWKLERACQDAAAVTANLDRLAQSDLMRGAIARLEKHCSI